MQSRAGKFASVVSALAGMCLCIALSVPVEAAADKTAAGQTVDSGSFGVFMDGKRVATETFSVHQGALRAAPSRSRFKAEAGGEQG